MESMKPIAIIQHVADDGPSYFSEWLAGAGLPFRLFALHHGEALPETALDHAGLCLLGGPMSANDGLPYQAAQLALIREAVANDIPVLGHCLGGQLMSKALGGEIGPAEHVEIGWSALSVETDADRRWFGGRDEFELFQWHGESFSIPPGGRRIASGRFCANQAFEFGGKHLAMQFHCEVDDAKVRQWLMAGHDELIRSTSPAVQQAASVLENLSYMVDRSKRVADDIYAEWAKGLVR
jgi:GMP synthase-like glutamine amidotransferase